VTTAGASGDGASWPVTTEVGPGLRGVIACTSQVSRLDAEAGTLAYRGIPIEELAGRWTFEQVAYLLISGAPPSADPQAYADFRARMRYSRGLPADVVALLRDQERSAHPTRVLRAAVSALGCHELTSEDGLAGERHWRELRIVGQVAALVGAIARLRRGLPDVGRVEQQGSLAHCMLCALLDREPEGEEVATLDLLWVLYADHGLDAPTFTSMVVASTRADPYFNVVAGLSALRGPRQGGVTERVLDLLLAVKRPERAAAHIRALLERGEPIPGFGHRLYRMPDPRAAVLREQAAALADRAGSTLFDTARAVEEAAASLLAPRGVHININFYAAVAFYLLGAEPPLIPCLFAVGRMAGLVARVHEALRAVRIYRPVTRYVGPPERSVPEGR
jgi:citrate synthase